jgi:hypothetical protein
MELRAGRSRGAPAFQRGRDDSKGAHADPGTSVTSQVGVLKKGGGPETAAFEF